MNVTNFRLILGSSSPRRKEILKASGFDFTIEITNVDESYPDYILAENVAEYLAWKKSKAFSTKEPGTVYLTADTVVIVHDAILGKPKDADEAYQMLTTLSGTIHKVCTGIALATRHKIITATDTAWVNFKKLTDQEIHHYIQTAQPFDKAGAYGVQDWMGLIGIEGIRGSFYTVMGLPTHLIHELLPKLNMP